MIKVGADCFNFRHAKSFATDILEWGLILNIKIKKFNIEDSHQVNAMAGWDCDKELYHLTTPVFDKAKALDYPDFDEVLKKYRNPSFSNGEYVIFDGVKPIGNLSLQIDPPHLYRKITGTGWLGLTIGEQASLRRQWPFLKMSHLSWD